jgi:hypothetical protein
MQHPVAANSMVSPSGYKIEDVDYSDALARDATVFPDSIKKK